jgi:hypothetical protein
MNKCQNYIPSRHSSCSHLQMTSSQSNTFWVYSSSLPTFADAMRLLIAFCIKKTSSQLNVEVTANCDALPQLPLSVHSLGQLQSLHISCVTKQMKRWPCVFTKRPPSFCLLRCTRRYLCFFQFVPAHDRKAYGDVGVWLHSFFGTRLV